MDLKQLHIFVVKPTLETLGLSGIGAERLVLGTGLTESGLEFISQVPSGVAKGFFQMELITHDDIWHNYLTYKGQLSDLVNDFIIPSQGMFNQLQGNIYYATAMCRVHYLRHLPTIPDTSSLEDLAGYWKRYYNTSKGAGSTQDFINKAKAVMSL